MTTTVEETKSFDTITQLINPNYPWKKGVELRKTVAKMYILPQNFL